MSARIPPSLSDKCPCGSGEPGETCCLPVIRDRAAITAEQLMRSRYTAYVLGDETYLLETWAPEYQPAELNLDPKQKWLSLKIKRTEAGGSNDDAGIVEFVARYKIDGRGHRLHEVSRFRRESGKWLYVTGEINP